MAFWSLFGLQDGNTNLIEIITYFHDYIIAILVVIMVFVTYIFALVLVKRGVDRNLIDSHFLEFIWTVVPMVFLLFIALPSLYLLYMTEEFSSYLLPVKIVAHQWYWEYQYYCNSALLSYDSYMSPISMETFRLLDVDNRMVLPQGVSSLLIVTSADVLHSWAVPSFGVKMDAIPGRLNYLNVRPIFSGVYYGQCSELCGSNHSFIPIVVEVVKATSFYSWIKSVEV